MNHAKTSAVSFALSLVAVALLAAPPAAQAYPTAELKCRAKIAAATRNWVFQTVKARQVCQRQIIAGKLPPSTDCLFGDGDDTLKQRLALLDAKLSRSLPRGCSGVNLILLGYPGPCQDTTGSPFDIRDLELCILNNGGDVVDELMAAQFPPMDRFYRGTEGRCLRRAGGRSFAMFVRDLRTRHKCLLQQENRRVDEDVECRNDIPPYSAGTGDEGFDVAIERAYTAWLASIARVCANADIAKLRYDERCPDRTGGAFTVFDLKDCNFDVNREQMLTYLGIAFPTEPVCGDGVTNGDEECDDGINGNSDTRPDACRTDCTLPSCGDTVTDPGYGEECDDGNTADGDGCNAVCLDEFCGDNIVNNAGTEECDKGDDNSDTQPNACRTDCREAYCGDGVEDEGEECDDGNNVNEDFCSADCKIERCGDGIIQMGLGEECDDAGSNANVADACRLTCKLPTCGDRILDTGEECERDDEGCNVQTCVLCGNGEIGEGEECDDGASNSDTEPDACRTDCQEAGCGDGVVDDGEQCDLGGGNSDSAPDTCRTSCLNPFCGDDVIDSGEECDDGLAGNSDSAPNACRTTCVDAGCGDGVIDSGEECDGDNAACSVTGETCGDSCSCANLCPNVGKLTLYAGTGRECATNADCPVGICDDAGSGRCQTVTDLDSGWKGLAHNSDINDETPTFGRLECPEGGPVCGECNVVGIDPQGRNCRCANDIRMVCDEPFAADQDDCGGATCQCYFGSPFSLSSAGTPACVVNRFSEDISGTANIDLGAGQIVAKLRTQVFLGESTVEPCPYCGGVCDDGTSRKCADDFDCGTCSNSSASCTKDGDCAGGTCQFAGCDGDDVADDGIRNGTCRFGKHDGMDCDVMALSTSFPVRSGAPGSGGYSLDCQPADGKNVSGAGLVINLTQTTGNQTLESNVPCGSNPSIECPCKVCTKDSSAPCNSDEECAVQGGSCSVASGVGCTNNSDCASVNIGPCLGLGRCQQAFSVTCGTNADCENRNAGSCNLSSCSAIGSGVTPSPNECATDQLCLDAGGEEGLCNLGPDDRACDLLVKANGDGVLSCGTNADCDVNVIGNDGGNCTLVKRRPCFLDPIVAQGMPDPDEPVGAAAFCIPPTSSAAINIVAGLPGPGRTFNQAKSELYCANDPNVLYEAGVGGCPDTPVTK